MIFFDLARLKITLMRFSGNWLWAYYYFFDFYCSAIYNDGMNRRPRFFFIISFSILIAVFFLGCVSAEIPPGQNTPEDIKPIYTEPVATVDTIPVEPEAPPVFDPEKVSVEVKQATLGDIKIFIDGLNTIIQNRDYERWYANLTDEYRSYYTKAEVLAELSEIFVIKRQGIVLRSLRDYFTYVVYPSRQNDKVDEIEFIDQNLIRAFTYSARGDKLVLYTLEKIDNTWKITRQ